jgi:two-component system, chemotaxis family, chemotaxis protein CheY
MDFISVLIVDDSLYMRKVVADALRKAGIELDKIFEAVNGAEALVVLAKNRVDLILSDINMPVMDGLGFIQALAKVKNAKGVPVVMLTTEGYEAQVLKAISLGARAYIRKPFSPDHIRQHILPLLGVKK